MPKNINQSAFDPKEFLAKVGDGKTILEFRKDQIVFAQGDAADTVFYIQKTLAEMIGTTRSRVSFFMNKFRKLGFISYNGKIEVNSSLLNAVLYDKPEIKSEL